MTRCVSRLGRTPGPDCRAGKDLLCRRRDTRLKRRRRQRSLAALAAPPLPQGDQHDRLLGCDCRDLVGGSDGRARMVGALGDCRGGPVILDCLPGAVGGNIWVVNAYSARGSGGSWRVWGDRPGAVVP